MTFSKDPPRLRTFGDTLPPELVEALREIPGEEATTAELEQLALAVRAAMKPDRAPTALPERRVVPHPRRQKSALFRGTLGLVMMFAIGAGAGVLVVTAAQFVPRVTGAPEATATTIVVAPSKPAARTSAPLHELKRADDVTPPADEQVAPPTERAPPTSALAVAAAPSVHSSAAAAVSSAAATAQVELQLLARAQAALDTDAGRALAITSDHERQFPHGALVQEREVIAIEALLRLGRRAEAAARAARFRRLYPTSVRERRIDVLLGTSPLGGKPEQ
jgi:hypothetical protein